MVKRQTLQWETWWSRLQTSACFYASSHHRYWNVTTRSNMVQKGGSICINGFSSSSI